jgi:general secretion pathway protein J
MPSDRARLRNGGFTLLELLLAMAITAIIMVLIFGTMRIGIRAWERGDRDVDQQQRLRIALEMMTHQLNALTRIDGWNGSGQPVCLDGTQHRIAFVSRMALDPARQLGVVQVRYEVETSGGGVDLRVIEAPLAMAFEFPDVDAPATQGLTLMRDMHDITFHYLVPSNSGQAPEWSDRWEASGASEELPLAIRVQVTDRPDRPPVRILVPLRDEAPR